jgi:hypothetical protein
MLLNIIPQDFSAEAVPINYLWSGYATNSAEFKEANFLKMDSNGLAIYVCSEENGVALGNYLSKYIIKQSFIRDMESVFSPGYDYWFFKAWEQAAPDYSELDAWVHNIVDLFVSSNLITRFKSSDTEYFAFSELTAYEEKPLPDVLIQRAETICNEALIAFCEQSYADYGDTEELSSMDVSSWGTEIIDRFIQAYQ